MKPYRGIRIDTGEWVRGWLHKLDNADNHKKVFIIPEYASALYSFEVIPETVGQYIGLEDKNGVEIYESDIAEHRYENLLTGKVEVDRYVVETQSNTVIKLVHSSGKEQWDRYLFLMYEEIEIIGNAHQHPHLLGEAKRS